jgi:hypothetical protein
VDLTPSPTNSILQLKRQLELMTLTMRRLTEDANVTKYLVEGERAGAFTYVMDSKEFVDG